jgi:hypothetical protein
VDERVGSKGGMMSILMLLLNLRGGFLGWVAGKMESLILLGRGG